MLDIKFIVDNRPVVEKALKDRGVAFDLDRVIQLYEQKKKFQNEFDSLRNEQNIKSKEISKLQKEKKDPSPVMSQMKTVADRVKLLGSQMNEVDGKLNGLLLEIPNIPHSSVPVGPDASANEVVRTWGVIPRFDFKPRGHGELGEGLGILDFDRGTKIAGARFTLYRGLGARLERALINFMLDVHTKDHGYEEVLPPFMVNAQSLLGTGQLPKFEQDLFKTTSGLYLTPTAEVPVTNIYRDEILREAELPIKLCAYTPCFRSEAGSYGREVRGLIRQHQFNKVELVCFSHPEKSYEVLEELTLNAEKILQLLGLPYRVVVLATGDMGFGASKTYDLEVWLPGQDQYREISSCTNFEAFQALRSQIRFKETKTKKNCLVHTLNGSGLAIGRTLVAILENGQNRDGTVRIPEALYPYLNGVKLITKSKVK